MTSQIPQFLKFLSSRHLPVLLQTEAAECGLTCIAMVASYWGHHIDLPGIRRRFTVSLKGTTLKSVISIARSMQLQARPLKLDLDNLSNLSTPCILHWDMNHFVVLERVLRSHALIHDPAIGKRKLSIKEISDHFTGVALELTPGPEFKSIDERAKFSISSLMGRVTGLKRSLTQLLLLGLSMQICALVAPFYLQWIVDEALVAADRDLVTVLGIGFLLLIAVQTSISAVRSWIASIMATNLNYQWLGNAFAHLLRLPLTYFERRHLGDVVSRFGSIQAIQKSLTTQFVEAIIDGTLVLGTLGAMLMYSAKLSVIAMISVGLYIAMRLAIHQALQSANSEQIRHAARQQTHFLESVRGLQSLRLSNHMDDRRIGWLNILAEQLNAELRISRISISYQSANMLLFNAERVIIIWFAAQAVLDAKFSVGMLFAFISYKDQFSQRMTSLVDKLFEFRMLKVHAERVADIVHTEPENDSDEFEIDVSKLVPSIEVRNLTYRYSEGEPYIFNGLNLIIPAGQCIAITGPSGCGKSTLVKLMLGLLNPLEGEILVGGIKMRSLGLSNYREIVGSVMQEDQLFSGSISDNICFFDSCADHERIVASAKLAAIFDEIHAMPMGFNTLVGDIGSGLSGGQKQRLLLARALYRAPKLLVLDEATSHLDVWNEQLVNSAVKQSNITRIVVAHRPETVAMADRIVEIRDGQVVRDFMNSPLQVAV